MLSQTLRAGRRHALQQTHRKVFFRRSYNGQNGPHTTYFQQPPPKQPSRMWRFVRSMLYVGLGAFFGCVYALTGFETVQVRLFKIWEASHRRLAHFSPALDLNGVNENLQSNSSSTKDMNLNVHTATLPSNPISEDFGAIVQYSVLHDRTKAWCVAAIYDGHAGPRTANYLQTHLHHHLGLKLENAGCFQRPYTPNDAYVFNVIKSAFLSLDQKIMDEATRALTSNEALAQRLAAVAPALSGSCALVAIYDPLNSVLRVANVGDSRAVLGRWDPSSNKYVAKPMSVDQTGFNSDEVARFAREHPGEDVVDPKTGRVHGIAISRAFGDSRWKWTEELTRKAHDLLWGPSPRPKEVIKTPPYLTAEPETMETKTQAGDFLIMASDGLWDQMSSEDAVTAVQMWLEKFTSQDVLQRRPSLSVTLTTADPKEIPFDAPADRVGEDGDDTYYDEHDKTLSWRVSPQHFVVEDLNCGEHLIKNALGGKRRDLLTGVMTLQAPLSRNVRDDITVHVIFF